jgi:hypothetical protein
MNSVAAFDTSRARFVLPETVSPGSRTMAHPKAVYHGRVPNRLPPNWPGAISLGPVAPVSAKELDFAIQLFEAGLRMKIPVSVSETRGVDLGDNAAAQMLIDAMPQDLGVRFVAQEGRIIPRDPELRRGAFLVLKHYDKHPLQQAIYIRTIAFHLLANSSNRNLWERWHKPVGGQREVPLHPAVIEAAAIATTTWHGQFEPEEFFCAVERIAKQKYAKAG